MGDCFGIISGRDREVMKSREDTCVLKLSNCVRTLTVFARFLFQSGRSWSHFVCESLRNEMNEMDLVRTRSELGGEEVKIRVGANI